MKDGASDAERREFFSRRGVLLPPLHLHMKLIFAPRPLSPNAPPGFVSFRRALPRRILAVAAVVLGSYLQAQSNYATPYFFTTLAGTAGTTGSLDGTGSAARFSFPFGVAVD